MTASPCENPKLYRLENCVLFTAPFWRGDRGSPTSSIVVLLLDVRKATDIDSRLCVCYEVLLPSGQLAYLSTLAENKMETWFTPL